MKHYIKIWTLHITAALVGLGLLFAFGYLVKLLFTLAGVA